jgi:hypothetical protein
MQRARNVPAWSRANRDKNGVQFRSGKGSLRLLVTKLIVSKYRNVSKYQHSVFVVIVVRPISLVFLASRLIVTLSSQTTAPLYETTEEHQGSKMR